MLSTCTNNTDYDDRLYPIPCDCDVHTNQYTIDKEYPPACSTLQVPQRSYVKMGISSVHYKKKSHLAYSDSFTFSKQMPCHTLTRDNPTFKKIKKPFGGVGFLYKKKDNPIYRKSFKISKQTAFHAPQTTEDQTTPKIKPLRKTLLSSIRKYFARLTGKRSDDYQTLYPT